MDNKTFQTEVENILNYLRENYDNTSLENISSELEERNISNPLIYGAWEEKNFELNLREDYERKTTFTNDFSIAEWFVVSEGVDAIADTLASALLWKDNIEYFAELLIVLNLKSWEHAARNNRNYSKMYADLYYLVKNLYFDWFNGKPNNNEAVRYYFGYVD